MRNEELKGIYKLPIEKSEKQFEVTEAILEDIRRLIGESEKVEVDPIDITDLYVCIYDECNIGVFKKQYLISDYGDNWRDEVYIGIDTDHVAATAIKQVVLSYDEQRSYPREIGTNILELTIDCTISESISYSAIRQKMFKEGLIDSTNIVTTPEEVAQTIDYAYDYFKIRKPNIQRRI